MPLMTLNRNYVLATTIGHSVRFRKDQPTQVPASVVHEAAAIGAIPEDKEVALVKGTDEVQAAAKEHQELAHNPVNRRAAIMTAIKILVETNERGSFDAATKPHPKAISDKAGFKVDAKERDVVWKEYLNELATAEDRYAETDK